MLAAFMILEITFVNLFKFSCIGYLLFHIYVLDHCILEGSGAGFPKGTDPNTRIQDRIQKSSTNFVML